MDSVHIIHDANSPMVHINLEKITKLTSDIRPNNVGHFSSKANAHMETDAIFYMHKNRNNPSRRVI
jgi:hypothetical protein